MKYFKIYKDKSKCWWSGSSELSSKHKMKKTDLELYGKVYTKGGLINHNAQRVKNNSEFHRTFKNIIYEGKFPE